VRECLHTGSPCPAHKFPAFHLALFFEFDHSARCGVWRWFA
jgi:hypothetical protein